MTIGLITIIAIVIITILLKLIDKAKHILSNHDQILEDEYNKTNHFDNDDYLFMI